MQVKLLNTEGFINSIDIAAHAALVCTGNEDYRRDDNNKFLTSLIEKGHESVIEHIVLSFEVDGVSMALLQEWARHRIQALSVRSTRYTLNKLLLTEDKRDYYRFMSGIVEVLDTVSEKQLQCELEDCARDDDSIIDTNRERVDGAIEAIRNAIYYVRDIFLNCSEKAKHKFADFAKYFLPEATPTKFVTTVNARELRHIFKLRSSPAALWEFQELTYAIYEAIPEEQRFLFEGTVYRG